MQAASPDAKSQGLPDFKDSSHQNDVASHFELLSESVIHQRYLTLFNRRVRFPASHVHPALEAEYDVAGHPRCSFCAVVCFPFHRATDGGEACVTLLLEYCQGANSVLYNLPSGGFEASKHADAQDCAAQELSEEAHLAGGEFVSLLPAGHAGVSELKWSANRCKPFLVIDAKNTLRPGARDAEEYMQVVKVTVAELRGILRQGDMLMPAVATCYMALDELQRREML